MSSLPRMLLRYSQSIVLALALCLSPEVEVSFAQAAHGLTSDLEFSEAQALILTPEKIDLADFSLAQSPLPESTQTPEFSESSAPEATETEPLATPVLTVDDFLNQPTIGSQLLLPPGQDGVKLLLAPASEASQPAIPLDSQLGLPGGLEGERQTSLAPVSSQRFLPAATQPVGLLPAAQEIPANPLAIAIENEALRIDNGELRIENGELRIDNGVPASVQAPAAAVQSSPQEQVGRTLARSAQGNFSQGNTQSPARSFSSVPRSTPALLAASTVPPSPLPQRSASQSLGETLQARVENQALGKPAQKATASVARGNAKPVSSSVSNPVVQTQANPPLEPDSESNAVASQELGVTIAAPESDSLWQSWKNQIWIALGAVALLGIALIRWAIGVGQGPRLEEETDWDHLPRSKSRTTIGVGQGPRLEATPVPVKPKRVSEEFLQFLEVGGRAPLRDIARDVPKDLPGDVSEHLASQSSAEKPTRGLASSALLERKPRQKQGHSPLPWDDQSPEMPVKSNSKANPRANSSEKEQPKRSFSLGEDTGLWITIVLIGVLGLAAWLIQFYGWV